MSQRKKWDRVKMKEAVLSVKNKEMGLLKASKTFGVPRSTLKDYVKKPVEDLQKLLDVPLGRKPILPPELEDELMEYCVIMEHSYYGVTSRDLKRMGFQLAIRNNISNPFPKEKKSAGRKWLRLFFKRHPALSLRKPQPLSLARIQGFSKDNVDKFFDTLKPELEKIQFSAARLFNVDETGVTTVQHKSLKVVALKGKKEIHKLSSAERGRLVTIVTCMSASGIFVPPMLVFPRKRMKQELLDGAPPGSIAGCHISGWIQSDLFTQWFTHFIKFVRATKEDPVVLILDGHTSHTRNLDIIDLARENGVSLVCLPPHSSDRMQPLDKTFMKPFKTYYSQEVEKWLLAHPFRAVTVFQVGQLIGKAYVRAANMNVALQGFKATGILPFNPHIFVDADFLQHQPSSMSHQPSESLSLSPTSQPSPMTDQQPSTSTSPTVVRTPVTPKDIMPVPKLIKKTPSARCGKAALVSGSPYKKALEESLNKQKAKSSDSRSKLKRKLKQTRKKSKTREREDSESSDSEEEEEPEYASTDDKDSSCSDSDDCECTICCGLYSNDKKGEQWVKCTKCFKWLHEACDTRKNKLKFKAVGKSYLCVFCS